MPETLSDIGEFGLIDRIDALLQKAGARSSEVTIGIGDDCAAFQPRVGYDILATCDVMVEGRHYLPLFISSLDLGRRAMTLNISDIGAMGGVPRYALVSLGLRSNMLVEDVEAIYRGFVEELNPFQAVIIGGNITRSEGANFIDITLIGEIEAGRSMRRSTARPGDAILVTGCPGEAAAGLQILLAGRSGAEPNDHPLVQAYNRPSHRAVEGAAIARSGLATAMIDTSDGLLGDLGHICDESGVGARIIQEELPVRPPLLAAAGQLKKDPLAFVLGDSDDYELIITCLPGHVADIRSLIGEISPVPVSAIGEITPPLEGEGNIQLTSIDGISRSLSRSGWNHFAR
jgi:thiamine-monophosphate kinase